MEIKPDVFNIGIIELSNHVCKSIANPELATFFVNQIYEILLFVLSVCLSEMFLSTLE